MRLRLMVLLVVLGLGASALAELPDLEPLRAEIEKVVTKHYPKADVTSDGETIQVMYDTRAYMIHDPTLTGEWQDAYEDIGPKKGGIYATLRYQSGTYQGMAAMPQSIDKRYFVVDMSAPSSKKLAAHFLVHLKRPKGASADFLKDFGLVTKEFEKYVTKTK